MFTIFANPDVGRTAREDVTARSGTLTGKTRVLYARGMCGGESGTDGTASGAMPSSRTHMGKACADGAGAGDGARVLVMLALGVLAAAWGASPATAATWNVAPDGSGDFPSIQETIDHARDGDTITIQAGRYIEDVTVHSKTRLTIIGAGREKVFIEGLNRVGTLHIGKWPYGATDVEISGLTIQQHGGLSVGIFNGEGITLKGLRIHGLVFGQQVGDVRIADCVVGGSETTGLAFADSHVTLTDNVIHDNDHGVSVGGDSTVRMERNVVMRSLFDAVLVTDSGRLALVRNTLVNNGGGVRFRDQAAGRVEGNIIAGADVGIAWVSVSPVTIAWNGLHRTVVRYQVDDEQVSAVVDLEAFADVDAAPRFVAPERGDYRLRADSPLLRLGGFAYLGALAPVPAAHATPDVGGAQ